MKDRCRPVAIHKNNIGATATTAPSRWPYAGTPLAAAIVTALYPATAAFAQSADSSGAKLEEVIVTATRRELNLQTVPQSITALSTDDIAKQALRNVSDVIGALPSVSLIANQPGRNNIVMRGITTGSDEFYTDSQVSIYLDDQPMTSNSQQVEVQLIDLARIESLPGPQGTLFGSSSQAGTIRYITNKPDTTAFSASFDGSLGTTKGGEESYDVSGHLNFPITDDFAVRVVGFYSQGRRLRRQRPWPDTDGRCGQFRGSRGRLERLLDLRRPYRCALADQPRVGNHAEPDQPGEQGGRWLGVRSRAGRLQDHALLRRVARRLLVPDLA